jgi:hypothetical protein
MGIQQGVIESRVRVWVTGATRDGRGPLPFFLVFPVRWPAVARECSRHHHELYTLATLQAVGADPS